MFHDGRRALRAVVALAYAYTAVSLGGVYYFDKRVPARGRLCLFLCVERSRRDDKHCLDDKARPRGCVVLVRSGSFT